MSLVDIVHAGCIGGDFWDAVDVNSCHACCSYVGYLTWQGIKGRFHRQQIS